MLDNFVVWPGSFLWIWQLIGMLPPVALVLGENILQVGPSRCGGIAFAFLAHNLRLCVYKHNSWAFRTSSKAS
ncbi:hypothetical protein C8J56DRAFT_946346 [Mycena floridula]|nr:hypothetical protein C8J56DRAFT_946346 [Mycena floridula]